MAVRDMIVADLRRFRELGALQPTADLLLVLRLFLTVVTEVTRPPKGRKRWSVRSMGRHAGVSHSTVQRIWSKNDLKPHVQAVDRHGFREEVLGRDRALS